MASLKLTKKYARYPKYKDSGVEWVGEIPEEWDLMRVKYLAPVKDEKHVFPNNGTPYIGMEHVESKTGKHIEPDEPVVPESIVNRFEIDDVLFGKLRPYLAKILHAVFEGYCTGEFLVLEPKQIHPRYLYYKLLDPSFINNVNISTYGARMPRASWNFIGNQYFAFPEVEEQQKIATYLDEKTALIDAIIEKKKKQIELLREKRAAIINRAVTKGLDADAKLVDSSVEWIGKIPEEWNTIDLGKILDYEQPGDYIAGDISEFQEEDAVQVLTAGKGFVIGYTKEKHGVYQDPLPVIIFDDFTTGKQFVDKPFKVRSSALKILKVRDATRNDIRYIYRCMEVLDFQTLEHNRHWISMYRRERIPWPTFEQQKKVADMLDEQDDNFRNAATKIETTIQFLQEFKSALISHVVTGKVKV